MTPYTLLRRLFGEPEVMVIQEASIRLDRALLCLDCEHIYQATGVQTCPQCASREAVSVGRAMNREEAA